jgi:hypothetical protein
METLERRLCDLVRATAWFYRLLTAVRAVNPPDWMVGGGVIRTLVWDHLHGYAVPTPLRDVDVAFYDPTDLTEAGEEAVEAALARLAPDVPWQATNQAAVHLWYHKVFGFPVPPLRSTVDGVSTWPETATSVGVRLLDDGRIVVAAPCGLDDLFQLRLRRNPTRVTRALFRERLATKRIQETWPQVTIVDD